MPAPVTFQKSVSGTLALTPRGVVTSGWWSAAVAMTMVTAVTVACNVAVMAALWRTKRAPMHYPLASLALADLLLGLFVMPIAAARELFVFDLPRRVCACWSTLDVLCCTASILSICILGWERWYGITAPLARARRSKLAKIFAILVWPLAIMVAMPTTFVPSPAHYQPNEMPKACSVNTNIGYVFFSMSFSFYIPAVVMVVLYGKILKALSTPLAIRAHRGRSPRNEVGSVKAATITDTPSRNIDQSVCTMSEINVTAPQISETPKSSRLNLPMEAAAAKSRTGLIKSPGPLAALMFRQRRATRTIIKLMAMFLVCWTPFFIMLPIDSICECVWDATWEWCTWLGYTNSALNPLIYAAASPSVRRAFIHSLSGTTDSRSSDFKLVACGR